jgi:hypothetical protein
MQLMINNAPNTALSVLVRLLARQAAREVVATARR